MLFLRINASYKLHLKRQLAHLNVVNDGGPLNGYVWALFFFLLLYLNKQTVFCKKVVIAECSHAPCFSMSHLELSYSKGHDLCLSRITGNAVSLIIDWELGIVLLETCFRFPQFVDCFFSFCVTPTV